jgi:hypothetical protein
MSATLMFTPSPVEKQQQKWQQQQPEDQQQQWSGKQENMSVDTDCKKQNNLQVALNITPAQQDETRPKVNSEGNSNQPKVDNITKIHLAPIIPPLHLTPQDEKNIKKLTEVKKPESSPEVEISNQSPGKQEIDNITKTLLAPIKPLLPLKPQEEEKPEASTDKIQTKSLRKPKVNKTINSSLAPIRPTLTPNQLPTTLLNCNLKENLDPGLAPISPTPLKPQEERKPEYVISTQSSINPEVVNKSPAVPIKLAPTPMTHSTESEIHPVTHHPIRSRKANPSKNLGTKPLIPTTPPTAPITSPTTRSYQQFKGMQDSTRTSFPLSNPKSKTTREEVTQENGEVMVSPGWTDKTILGRGRPPENIIRKIGR